MSAGGAQDPLHAWAQLTFTTALAHHRAGRLDEAELLYREMIDRRPGDPQGYFGLGLLSRHRGRNGEAMGHLLMATSLGRREPAYHFALGQVMAELGEGAVAAACFVKATELAPHYGPAHEALALVLQAMGDEARAERCFRQALAADPALPLSRRRLDGMRARRGDGDEDESTLDELWPAARLGASPGPLPN